MPTTSKISVCCIDCSEINYINKSTYCAYKKRNNTDQYICLSCKNKRRSKPTTRIVKCEKCGEERELSKKSKPSKLCPKCRHQRKVKPKKSKDEIKKQISQSVSKAWKTNRERFVAGIRRKYEDKEYADKISKHLTKINKDSDNIKRRREKYQRTLATTDLRKRISDRSQRLWQSQGFRESVINGMMKPEVREKMAQGREKQPRVSSLENSLSKILSDLGVSYKSNVKIAFYHWDFLIEHGDKHLLIEVNGDYWHRRVAHVVRNDKSKRTYFERHLSDKYELKYLWEHEFLCVNKVYDKLRYWLGMTKQAEFSFNDIQARIINKSEVFPFLTAYHYLKPKDGFNIGAYLGDKLVAVAVFSPPTRLEVATSLDLEYDSIYELSRFCICPGYNRHNFASWFLSRARIWVYNNTNKIVIVAFSDKAMNHSGYIYLADNWSRCGDVPSDYWYVDKDGYQMHKRTLYGHAVRMGMKEAEFAKEYGYEKVRGMGKCKFVHYK